MVKAADAIFEVCARPVGVRSVPAIIEDPFRVEISNIISIPGLHALDLAPAATVRLILKRRVPWVMKLSTSGRFTSLILEVTRL